MSKRHAKFFKRLPKDLTSDAERQSLRPVVERLQQAPRHAPDTTEGLLDAADSTEPMTWRLGPRGCNRSGSLIADTARFPAVDGSAEQPNTLEEVDGSAEQPNTIEEVDGPACLAVADRLDAGGGSAVAKLYFDPVSQQWNKHLV